jgi:hypothetical protein
MMQDNKGLHWKENKLFLGKICVGWIEQNEDSNEWAIAYQIEPLLFCEPEFWISLESEARTYLENFVKEQMEGK